MKKLTIITLSAVLLVIAAGAAVYATMSEESGKEPENIELAASGDILSDDEIAAMLEPRRLGPDDAPITISEHSSFSCGHCGKFHKETFKQFREAYIDTGKVQLIFSDFPLNGPALDASAVARCVDEDQYFNFVQLLFEAQDQWAYSSDYKDFLKQNAQLAGVSEEKFEACITSEKLKEGLLEQVKEVQAKHEINSTPSFVINDEEVVSGALSFEVFSKIIEKHSE